MGDGGPAAAPAEVDTWFDGELADVAAARRLLRSALAAQGRSSDDAELALTELAANAVRHGGGAFRLRAHLDGGVRLEVEDRSSDLPVLRRVEPDGIGGRGLHLIGAVCERWGVERTGGGKVVWAELLAAPPQVE